MVRPFCFWHKGSLRCCGLPCRRLIGRLRTLLSFTPLRGSGSPMAAISIFALQRRAR